MIDIGFLAAALARLADVTARRKLGRLRNKAQRRQHRLTAFCESSSLDATAAVPFPPPLRGRAREGGAPDAAASAITRTTPSRFFMTSSFVNRSTRYPRNANQRSRRSS